MPKYDIIGDIHGCADSLRNLLNRLGYRCENGIYQHPVRQAVFLGDFIDRGPKQKEVLDIVRPMIENGSALSVMGNHEFNAICYATLDENGNPVREHDKKHTGQHKAFLEAYPYGSEEYYDVVEWFKTLPAFLELDDILLVHACWDEDSISILQPSLNADKTFQDSAYLAYGDEDSDEYQAIENLLKGPEHELPEKLYFHDKDSNLRKEARLCWWVDEDAPPDQKLAFGGAELSQEQQERLSHEDIRHGYEKTDKPVFFGHYWLGGEPKILSENATCLDYSIAKGGKLMAYRWDGEAKLEAANFVWVNATPLEMDPKPSGPAPK